jgi:hypothetical protein
MARRTNHTILVTFAGFILTALLSKGMGAQEVHEKMNMMTSTIPIRENMKGQILLR